VYDLIMLDFSSVVGMATCIGILSLGSPVAGADDADAGVAVAGAAAIDCVWGAAAGGCVASAILARAAFSRAWMCQGDYHASLWHFAMAATALKATTSFCLQKP
jgi:hypothetical protein